MGHLINPISFRLGYSRNWGFSGALMESKSQYFYLNAKYYNILLFFKRIFSLQTFEKMGILFSHLRFVGSQKSDYIIIYLYDGPFQNESFIFYKYLNRFKRSRRIIKYCKRFFKRFMRRTFFLFYYIKSLELIYVTINNFIFELIKIKLIKFMYIVGYIKSNLKIIDNIYFLKSFFSKALIHSFINELFLRDLNNFLYSCFVFDYVSNIFLKIYNVFLNKNLLFLFIYRALNKTILNYCNFNVKFFVKIFNFFFGSTIFLKNNLLIFLSTKKINSKFLKNIKMEYLNEILNVQELMDIFHVKKTYLKSIKLFLNNILQVLLIQRLKFFEYCEKFLTLIKRGKKKKFIFLNFFFKFLIFFSTNFFIFLKNIIFLFNSFFFNTISKKSLIYFKNVSKKEITAALITKYICVRLKQKFTLKEIIRPILKDLINNSSIKGFRLSCCGRFTKKEIATYRWERRGHTSLNTVDACIDYSFNYVILKYSVCGIKIWLHKNSSYKYFFKKWFENLKFFYKQKKKKKRHKFFLKKNQKFIIKFKKKDKGLKLVKKKLENKDLNNKKKVKNFKILYKKINKVVFKKFLKPFLKI
jgi:hypothetical protein